VRRVRIVSEERGLRMRGMGVGGSEGCGVVFGVGGGEEPFSPKLGRGWS